MTRLAPWLGSLLVHGTLVAAATQCRHEQAARMEMVDAELVFPEIAEAPVAADREEAVEDVAEAVGPPTMEAPKPVREAAQTARRPREAASASESMAAEAPAPPAAQLPPWQGLDAENGLLAGALGTDGTGRAGGAGRAGAIAGSGSGTGPGRGEQRSGRPVVPVRRAAARSRARPPRLVYPVRDREERPGARARPRRSSSPRPGAAALHGRVTGRSGGRVVRIAGRRVRKKNHRPRGR
jgi:hypothetical protein